MLYSCTVTFMLYIISSVYPEGVYLLVFFFFIVQQCFTLCIENMLTMCFVYTGGS